jgi:FKBP-type peptidyl-prolyl cis-trans isomerase
MGYYKILILCSLLSLFVSCEKDNPIEKQEERIESYLKTKMTKNPALKLSQENNVRYLYTPGDTTLSVSAGDSVYFYYAGTLVVDTLRYFDTNIRELAEGMGLTIENRNFNPLGVVVGNNNLLPGLSIGLNMVHLGDSGEIIFNSDLGFGGKTNGIIPANAPLIFKIFVIGFSEQ